MDYSWIQWIPMDLNGSKWIQMNTKESQWIPMNPNRFQTYNNQFFAELPHSGESGFRDTSNYPEICHDFSPQFSHCQKKFCKRRSWRSPFFAGLADPKGIASAKQAHSKCIAIAQQTHSIRIGTAWQPYSNRIATSLQLHSNRLATP